MNFPVSLCLCVFVSRCSFNMLRELHISNLAVISDARIELSHGLNCFTGATGAGKSLIIGAMEVLLGLRSPSEMLRTGVDEGRVSGVFELHGDAILKQIEAITDAPIRADGGELLVTRRLFSSGRTSATTSPGQFPDRPSAAAPPGSQSFLLTFTASTSINTFSSLPISSMCSDQFGDLLGHCGSGITIRLFACRRFAENLRISTQPAPFAASSWICTAFKPTRLTRRSSNRPRWMS